jgi:uncharacterized protein YcnI
MRHPRLAAAAAAAATVLALVGSAVPASAHVTIPGTGTQGGFSTVTFKVPNERDDSQTVTFEVQLPEDHPLRSVSVQPKPGWEVTTTMRTLDEPLVASDGSETTEVVDTVTWSGGSIGAGQFDTFSLSVGPLPDDVDELGFPAIQTYASGEEVSWIEPTPASGEEPEHPTPTLQLVAADGGGSSASSGSSGSADQPTSSDDGASESAADDSGDDDGTDGLAVVALVQGIVGIVLGAGALVTSRRRPA